MHRPGSVPALWYGRPTRAEIDLEAVAANARRLQAHVGAGVGILGVVKADAYGHGAVPVARALVERGGVAGLAVTLLEEGLELRRAGVGGMLLVMGAVYTHAHLDVLAHDLVPVISEVHDVEQFARAAKVRGQRARVHVKIDTGMARLGVRPEELGALSAALVAAAPEVEVVGLMTHLSSADSPESGPSVTAIQLQKFRAAVDVLASAGIRARMLHAANSVGAIRFAEGRFDAVRPGLVLYGGGGTFAAGLGLEAAMRLVSGVVQLRWIEAGDAVSYGGHVHATRRTHVATVPMGYADGYPRRVNLPGTPEPAEVLIRGRRCRVLGTVCMDMIMVDVTELGDGVAVGEEVVLLGAQGSERITASELAQKAGLIEYEITCGVSKRVPRVYRKVP
jgi:alanine racemase